MADRNVGTASGLFMWLIVFAMVIAILTLISAIGLSVLADTTLTAKSDTGEIIHYGTATGKSVDHLWKAFSGSLGTLSGLAGGKSLP